MELESLAKMRDIKCYLPSGVWEKAKETRRANLQWIADVKKGKDILIRGAMQNKKIWQNWAEAWKKEVGEDESPCG